MHERTQGIFDPTVLGSLEEYVYNKSFDVVENGSGKPNAISEEDIKKAFNNRCATCGSPEGEQNYRNPSLITKLQKGHMNNEHGSNMSKANIIPQCLECNQAYRDKVNFDETGLVDSLSSTELVLKSSPDMRRKIFDVLKKEFEKN